MSDRRRIQVRRAGAGFQPDRRVLWMDRRQHHGFFRFLYIDLSDLWRRCRSGDS